MSIKMYITSGDPRSAASLRLEDREVLTTLGTKEEAIGVQLQELFASISEALSTNLEFESQLTVEVSGSISLKADGGLKYLFFNVNAQASGTSAMKVVLSTTLKPKAGS